MKIRLIKPIVLIMIFIFVLIFLQTSCLAVKVTQPSDGGGSRTYTDEEVNPADYNTTLKYDDATYIFGKGAIILKTLRNIAAIVAVLVLSILGVRYMVGSVEQKAEYKQTMIPVVIGCILIVSLSAILGVIDSIF